MAESTAAIKPETAKYISNPLELFSPSYDAIRVNFGTLLKVIFTPIAAVLAVLAIYATMNLAGLTAAANSLVLVLSVLLVLTLMLILIPAVTIVMLKSARGEKIGFGEVVRTGRPFALRMLGLSLLQVLLLIVGFLLFIIPGFIFLAWFSLSSYVLVDEDLGVVASLKRSKELVSGHVVEMWGLLSIGSALGVLNIFPILGTIAAVVLNVIYAPSTAIRYLQLQNLGDSKTETHWMNYLVIIIGLLASGTTARADFSRFDESLRQVQQEASR